MQLSPEDAALFFKLMPALQAHANGRLQIIKDIETPEQYKKTTNEKRIQLRNALYKEPEIIDEFVRENPFGLSPDELAIVSGWKNFVAGDFFIDRILKKYAIFIGNNKVYAVLALMEPLQDVLAGMPLPAYVKTVLLPFKGRIIYDGLIEGYSIFFGPGISTSMSDTYRAAKQQGKIIESLDPGWRLPEPKIIVRRDWTPLLEELLEKASKLRATRDDPAVLRPVFNLIRVSLNLARDAVENPEDFDALDKQLQKIERTVAKARETAFYSDFEF
jgi:hypothetical protein